MQKYRTGGDFAFPRCLYKSALDISFSRRHEGSTRCFLYFPTYITPHDLYARSSLLYSLHSFLRCNSSLICSAEGCFVSFILRMAFSSIHTTRLSFFVFETLLYSSPPSKKSFTITKSLDSLCELIISRSDRNGHSQALRCACACEALVTHVLLHYSVALRYTAPERETGVARMCGPS